MPDAAADPGATIEGAPNLVLLIGSSDDLRDALLSIEEGGRKLERGLAAAVEACTEGSTLASVRRATAANSEAFLEALRRDPRMLAGVDVVVLSVASDTRHDGSAADAARRYEAAMGELAALVKERKAHLIVFNASSFDPADTTSCYAGVPDTPSLLVQHLNRSLIELSVLDGLSIVDADRIIAEVGGKSHVEGLLSYSTHVCALLCQELLRVLDDYGFFDDRPLLAQVGRRET